MKLNFRIKILIVLALYIVFWFAIFYPFVMPWMNANHLYPLIATMIYESLFYVVMLLMAYLILGKSKHSSSLKLALVLFLAYHIVDAVEPPFILNASGFVDSSNPSAIISWDYGVGYTLHHLTGLSWSAVYYITNIGVVLLLLLLVIMAYRPQMLGKVFRKIL
jgi:hypothetical protein